MVIPRVKNASPDMILTAFDVKFREKQNEIPPEACRPLTTLKKNNVEKVDPQTVKQKQCQKVEPKKVEKTTMSEKLTVKKLKNNNVEQMPPHKARKNNDEKVDPQKVEKKQCRESGFIYAYIPSYTSIYLHIPAYTSTYLQIALYAFIHPHIHQNIEY